MFGRKDNNVINTGYRFRLFPDEHQEQLISQNLGACRWLYNRMLSDRTETYRQSDISEKRTPAWYKHLHPYCDWHQSAIQWEYPQMRESTESVFGYHFSKTYAQQALAHKGAEYFDYLTFWKQ